MQAGQQLLYRGTLVVLDRLSSVYGDDSVPQKRCRPSSKWPLLPIIAISSVLQHLRNRRLSAAATGRQHDIHPQTVRNRLRQNVQPICAYRQYFGQIFTRRHRTARRDWYCRHLHFRRADRDLILFSNECRFNLSNADGRESLSPSGSVLPMRASLSGTISEVVQS